MTTVELLVRDHPCTQHPDEEWLDLRIGGDTILSTCTGALTYIARTMRGKDMLGWGLPNKCTPPPDVPSSPDDYRLYWEDGADQALAVACEGCQADHSILDRQVKPLEDTAVVKYDTREGRQEDSLSLAERLDRAERFLTWFYPITFPAFR